MSPDPIARARDAIRDTAEWVDAILREAPDANARRFVRESVARLRQAGAALPQSPRGDGCEPELAPGDYVLAPVQGMPFRASAYVTGVSGDPRSPDYQVSYEGVAGAGPSLKRGDIEVIQRGPHWPPSHMPGDTGTMRHEGEAVRVEILAVYLPDGPRSRPLASFASLPGEARQVSGGSRLEDIAVPGRPAPADPQDEPGPKPAIASLALHGTDPSLPVGERPIAAIELAARLAEGSADPDTAAKLRAIYEAGLGEDPHGATAPAILDPRWAVTLDQASYMLRDYRAKGGAPGRMPQILRSLADAARAGGDGR